MSNHSTASTDLVSFNCFITVLYFECVIFLGPQNGRGNCNLPSKNRCGSNRCSLKSSVLGCISAANVLEATTVKSI